MGASVADDLLAWFARAKRDLPWRTEPRDPYRTWLAEVMLQQTQVATVVPYFRRFLERFPAVEDLAAADESDVLKAWEGLGYYARARSLHRAAREVAGRGGLPRSEAALRALPGFGPYTAGAVASLAFGERAAAVDGNVLRVLARLDADASDVASPATRRRAEARALALQPPASAGPFNEALMELGATVCLPRTPDCGGCPVARHCRARALGRVADYPVKSRKAKPAPVDLAAALVARGDRVFLVRPASGLLAGMHALPTAETAPEAAAEAVATALRERHGFSAASPLGVLGEVRQAFTHRRWRVRVVAVSVRGRGRDGTWVPRDRLARIPLARWTSRALALGA